MTQDTSASKMIRWMLEVRNLIPDMCRYFYFRYGVLPDLLSDGYSSVNSATEVKQPEPVAYLSPP
jgi:hypothetical protein